MATPGKPSSIHAPATKTAAAHSAQATPSANAAPATNAISPKRTTTSERRCLKKYERKTQPPQRSARGC